LLLLIASNPRGFAARGTKKIVLDKGVVGCYYEEAVRAEGL